MTYKFGLVTLALGLALPQGAIAQDPAGCWVGTFAQARGIFELERSGGGWRGEIHRLGQVPVASDTLAGIVIEGDRLDFSFPSTLGAGTATFSGSTVGSALTGTITSGGQALPVSMTRVEPSESDPMLALAGYWSGGLEQAGTLMLRLGFGVAAAPCGQVIAHMDSPDQGAENIPVSAQSLVGDSLRFEIAAIAGSFRGVVNAARTQIEGLWSQGGGTIEMSLARSDGPAAFARPQDPVPPFPYEQIDVTYTNPRDGTQLAGTLTLPDGGGPFPAALLLTGSGAQDRNETLMGHRPFLVISDHLTRHGIAVLRVDDRGVGGSTGNVMNATIRDNVADAAAGVSFLRKHPRIDHDRVGLIGHSEGGWVAPALATESDDVAFVVMLAGPAVSPYELLVAQNEAILTASGEDLIEEKLDLTRTMLDIVMSEPDDDAAIAEMRAATGEWLASLPAAAEAELRAEIESELYQVQFTQSLESRTTPWFRGLLAHDPVPSLEALDVPVLALFGERDLQVPPDQSAAALEIIWLDHRDATVRIFPELNHLFQHAESGLMAEYAAIDETFAPEALQAITEWILARFGS